MSKALRRLALGLCGTCGGFPLSDHSTRMCEPCRVRRNERIKLKRLARRARAVVGHATPEPQPDREVHVDGYAFRVVFDGRQSLSGAVTRHLDLIKYGAEP